MFRQRYKTASRQWFALVAALSCLWFGTFGAFLHTDCVPVVAALAASCPVTSPASASPSAAQTQKAKLQAAPVHQHAHSCAVCEWQTNILAPALPIQTVVPPSHRAIRIVTHLPRYLSASPVLASSRAPPFTL